VRYVNYANNTSKILIKDTTFITLKKLE